MTPIEKLIMLRDVALNGIPDRDVTSADIHSHAARIGVAAQIQLVVIAHERAADKKANEERLSTLIANAASTLHPAANQPTVPATGSIAECEHAVDQANKNASSPALVNGAEG